MLMLYLAQSNYQEAILLDNPWREVEAVWQGGTTFIGHNPSGGSVQMGSLQDKPGISPMELLLAGIAGCTGMDVANILEKKRQPIESMKIRVRGKLVEQYPRIFDEIEIEYLIWGNGIDPAAVEQAIHLSEEKYCSVSAMLRAVADIRWSYKIMLPDQTT
jgi:putative redox protein